MTATYAIAEQDRLEQLVDRVLSFLFPGTVDSLRLTLARLIHQARNERKAGHLQDALDTLSSLDMALLPRDLACWAYNEWLTTVRWHYLSPDLILYRAGTGQAAVVEPDFGGATVTVLASLGLDWVPGKVLSRRCLRGLKPLHPRGETGGGGSCR